VAEIAPTVVFPPGTPLTLQVTAVFDDPATTALNCFVCDKFTEALAGEIVTETALGPVTVTVA
jgi:hypothetical protein